MSSNFDFTLLGPLTVRNNGRVTAIPGAHQRAVLGYLLLHDNDVIPTSRLLKMIWGDDPPRTARKMLQNAVSGLRSTFAATSDSQAPILLTHAPGYLLQVDAQSIDSNRFAALADSGRSLLQEGKSAEAANVLRAALDMWRGDVLTDLVELGFHWPELYVLRESRLAALENCFVADLACGRHHEIIGELELAVTAEPTREQLCGLLMLAAYRAGRQGDALAAYRRLRARLVDKLGTEPGESLRALEHDILNHAPRLDAPAAAHRQVAVLNQARAPRWPRPAQQVAQEPASRPTPPPIPIPIRLPEQASSPRAPGRRSLTVALFTASRHVSEMGELVSEQVRRHGGVVAPGPGSSWCGYFGATSVVADHAERALAAARGIAQISMTRFPGAGVRVAMHTTETTVTGAVDDPRAVPSVDSGVLDGCWRLATAAVPGHVVVSAPSGGHLLFGVLAEEEVPAVPFVGRGFELELLQGLVRQVCGSGRPAMATLIGAAGVGKTRLTTELAAQVRDNLPGSVYVMRATVDTGGAPLPVLAELIRDHLGLGPTDVATGTDHRLAGESSRPVGSAGRGRALLSQLRTALRSGPAAGYQPELINRCLEFFHELARERPLVLIVDDLHSGSWDLLAALGDLRGDRKGSPVLVLATARPELTERLPAWGTDQPHSLNFVLGGLSSAAMSRLMNAALNPSLRVLHFGQDSSGDFREDPHEFGASEPSRRWHALLSAIDGNPRRAVRYATAFNAALTDQDAMTNAEAVLRADEIATGGVVEDRFSETHRPSA